MFSFLNVFFNIEFKVQIHFEVWKVECFRTAPYTAKVFYDLRLLWIQVFTAQGYSFDFREYEIGLLHEH